MTGRSLRSAVRQPAVLVVVALAALAFVLANCGIPTQGAARSIPATDLPPNLTSRQPAAAPSTTTPSYATAVNVYFTITAYRYVAPVQRQVQKATITTILSALLGGPNQAQARAGYQSALTTSIRLIHAGLNSAGVATVDFNYYFGRISGSLGALAVAQVVYTLTANIKTITGVQFQTDDSPINVPTPTGALVTGPVTPKEYQTLLQPDATASALAATASAGSAAASGSGSGSTGAVVSTAATALGG